MAMDITPFMIVPFQCTCFEGFPLLCWIAGGFPSIGFVHILQKGWVNWGPSVCSQASQTAQEANSRWQLGQEMRGTKCRTTRS